MLITINLKNSIIHQVSFLWALITTPSSCNTQAKVIMNPLFVFASCVSGFFLLACCFLIWDWSTSEHNASFLFLAAEHICQSCFKKTMIKTHTSSFVRKMHHLLEEAASHLNRKLIYLWYDFDLDHFYLYLWRIQTEIVCGVFLYWWNKFNRSCQAKF